MSQVEWLIASWIIAVFGWLMFFAERSCLRKVAEISNRTFKTLNEAIEYKEQTIRIWQCRHSELAMKAKVVVDLHDKGMLSKEDSNAIELLRIHAEAE